MFLPTVPGKAGWRKKQVTFGGLNRQASIAPGELLYSENMTTEHLPVLGVRRGKKQIEHIAYTTQSIEAAKLWYDGHYLLRILHEQDSEGKPQDTIYFNAITGPMDQKAKIQLVSHTKAVVMYQYNWCFFPACIYAMRSLTSTDPIGDPSKIYPDDPGSAPPLTCACVYLNRIAGAFENMICLSALGDMNDWTTFTVPGTEEPAETGAWMTTVETEGEFTACVSYGSHVLFFKEREMYELYGYSPVNFTLVKVADTGCIAQESIAIVGGTLYFLSREGVMAYSGGVPRYVSMKIMENPMTDGFVDAHGCAQGECYYLSAKGKGTYLYDPRRDVWLREDRDAGSICFAEGVRYQAKVGADFKTFDLFQYGHDSEQRSFTFETGQLFDDRVGKRQLTRLNLVAESIGESALHIEAALDEGDFEPVVSRQWMGLGTFEIPFLLRPASSIRLRFSGKGDIRFHLLERQMIGGR